MQPKQSATVQQKKSTGYCERNTRSAASWNSAMRSFFDKQEPPRWLVRARLERRNLCQVITRLRMKWQKLHLSRQRQCIHAYTVQQLCGCLFTFCSGWTDDNSAYLHNRLGQKWFVSVTGQRFGSFVRSCSISIIVFCKPQIWPSLQKLQIIEMFGCGVTRGPRPVRDLFHCIFQQHLTRLLLVFKVHNLSTSI